MDKLIERIMDSDKWPSIGYSENMDMLNEMADECFNSNTISGMLSATLMYHQLIEAMCIHLLDDCHFFIQLSIYPANIEFPIDDKKMLGVYINELKRSISFDRKDDFIEEVTKFNLIRNDVIHNMRKNNLAETMGKLAKIKCIFDNIYNLYDEIQDDFRVDFHNFKKDVFCDYI